MCYDSEKLVQELEKNTIVIIDLEINLIVLEY